MILPESIEQMISGKAFTADETGLSGAKVMVFDDCVLKIAPYRKQNEETVAVMRWLEGRLPVPKVLRYERDAERQYLLMSRVPGTMACDAYYLERPEELAAGLAEAIRMLWSVDVSGCPRCRDIDAELEGAKHRVANRLADPESAEAAALEACGPKDPARLLDWLESNKPTYEPVFSHGDLCLPNIFLDSGRVSGFIDLGDAGIGDKWKDVALCWRSLKRNAEGAYGGKVYPDVRPDMLFEALGVEPDHDKIRYHLLLNELF